MGSALTADETVEKLSEREVNQDTVTQVHTLLKDFETAQFGSAETKIRSREEIVKSMKTLAKRLEKQIR